MIKIKRVAIFIDEANIRGSQEELKIYFDYIKLKDFLVDKNELYNCFMYSQGNADSLHVGEKSSFYQKLTLSGFTIKFKPKKPILNKNGQQKNKCNVDVELTLDVITTSPNYDIACLLTGDGDFCKLVDYLRFHGKEVIGVSTKNVCSLDFKNSVDKFIDLNDIKDSIKLNKPHIKQGLF